MNDEPAASRKTFWLWALALCLPPAFIPNYNHDLFWHLLDARWLWAHRGLPLGDPFSWTKAGAPWVDFEWLWELGAGAFWRAGGMPALMALKFLYIAASTWAFARLLACRGLKTPWLAAGLVLWSAQMLPHCGLSPDLLSLLFFTMTLLLLESRLEKWRSWPLFLTLLLFALWSQAHAAFIMGLALFPCYIAAEVLARNRAAAKAKLAALGAAVLGSLCNPYGFGPYVVLLRHLHRAPDMTRFIREWSPLPFNDPLYWPFWAALALGLGLAILAAARKTPLKKIPWSLVFAAVPLAVLSIRHARFSAYFNAPACLLLAALAQELFPEPRASRRASGLFLAAYAAFLLGVLPRLNWDSSFHGPDLPRAAARFMAAERPEVEPLRLYHPWEWGGYLAWRLRPWFRVFGDGRYIFHEQHARAEDAFASARQWQGYLKREGADAALLPNVGILLDSTRLYPNGKTKAFRRPWFVFYMPRRNWALVYWDSKDLFFVARGAAPKAWIAAHDYRYLHPRDQAAFKDALKRGEINLAELRREEIRHAADLRAYGGF
ncbi:MAG TPA: hypothetical protein VNH15_01105 [Elusimicrobiota bacterium]|nr:hypothetical protein [Elusimicrobiota bacterium]